MESECPGPAFASPTGGGEPLREQLTRILPREPSGASPRKSGPRPQSTEDLGKQRPGTVVYRRRWGEFLLPGHAGALPQSLARSVCHPHILPSLSSPFILTSQ